MLFAQSRQCNRRHIPIFAIQVQVCLTNTIGCSRDPKLGLFRSTCALPAGGELRNRPGAVSAVREVMVSYTLPTRYAPSASFCAIALLIGLAQWSGGMRNFSILPIAGCPLEMGSFEDASPFSV